MYLDGLIPGMPPHGCPEQAGLVLSRCLEELPILKCYPVFK